MNEIALPDCSEVRSPYVPPTPDQGGTTDPAVLGRWTLRGRLGAGGMGTTYLAGSAESDRATVKVLREDLADNHEFRARFAPEVALLDALDGSHTAAVLDANLDAEPPYLVLEYLDGPTLAEKVDSAGPLPASSIRALADDLATVLATVHAAGIVHRDLKPANVILTTDGARLIGFGVASAREATSLTRTGVLVGSPGWLAPEQLTGEEVGSPADVFGWGAVVTYAATGRSPFRGGRPERTMYAVLHDPPDLKGTPPDLASLLQQALNKDPRQRPSAADLRSWLHVDAARTDRPLPTVPPTPPMVRRRSSRRASATVAVSVALLLLLVGGLGYTILQDGGAGSDGSGPDVAAGDSHSLALRSDGTVVAWGDDGSGLSDVPAGLSDVTAIPGGRFHSLALVVQRPDPQSTTGVE